MLKRPLALSIGLRYTRAKRRNHFISFIAIASMIGIALGVMVLVTVLSVMNGFDEQIQARVFSLAPQITFSTDSNLLRDWQALDANVVKQRGVVATAPYVYGQGILSSFGQVHPAAVFGIMPDREAKISDLGKSMKSGSLQNLVPGNYGIVLGEDLAANLTVSIGDKLTLITPTASFTPIGIIPRFKRFTVVGIFSAGNGFGFDSNYAYINMQDAQALYQLGSAVSGLRLKVKNVYQAPEIAATLLGQLPANVIATDWTEQYGPFFQAIATEKTMMFLVLLLIIAIAAFNLVSSLVMVVTDKVADIAILRTLGATPTMIMHIFMIQGTLIGVVGTLLGLITGILLSLHVTEIFAWLQQVFHISFLSSNVYYVNFLPSHLMLSDILKVAGSALVMSFVATWYPSWRAASVQPAEALRYE